MAVSSSFPIFGLLFLTALMSSIVISHQQPLLDSAEQDSLFQVLYSINSAIPWRTLFPDDLCLSAPHGIVCEYFTEEQPPLTPNSSVSTQPLETAHISELSFGFVSDYTPNPPCSPNSTINPLIFTSFKFLRKLFFYNCFTEMPVSVPDVSSSSFGDNLEELVFIENPALVGSLSGIIGNFTNLRRLVLTGNGIYGNIPDGVGSLVSMEEVTVSRNQLSGGVPVSLAKLKKLRVLDLSHNYLDGDVPLSVGNLSRLLKLDLSHNRLSGKIPDSFVNLQGLEFLDLSFNKFGNFGVPLFLGEMPRLKEVYLSGNLLGGHIPEIWERLGGISGIGFSDMGLVGKIPASMGLHLRSLCYLGLDNNMLEGTVPEELGFLDCGYEINLENNNLSGKIPVNFTAKKLKLKGNSGLCVDGGDLSGYAKFESSLGKLKLCNKSDISSPVLLQEGPLDSSSSSSSQTQASSWMMLGLGFLFVLSC
ncbi:PIRIFORMOSPORA INDICA-INSENSITIVE PROTEIN 2-LIKE [Salix viminalis]|uniref:PIRIFORMOSPORA INDICA-INSENSITIVE PROTEIN 2-LIKE n=1 Tax=Salix viminalis TaxID=40686 RepID=A0A9Q0ZJ34_SALVM|nr:PIRIFORMOSPORA INDICA-INSENSITIVE PROTEIN 2-LIKE [Salix viminalis]